MAAGTTGTPARSASAATPGWPGTSRPSRLKGPSGKMPMMRPASSARSARLIAPGSGRERFTGMEPMRRWKAGWSGLAWYTRGMTRKEIGRGTATPSTTPSR